MTQCYCPTLMVTGRLVSCAPFPTSIRGDCRTFRSHQIWDVERVAARQLVTVEFQYHDSSTSRSQRSWKCLVSFQSLCHRKPPAAKGRSALSAPLLVKDAWLRHNGLTTVMTHSGLLPCTHTLQACIVDWRITAAQWTWLIMETSLTAPCVTSQCKRISNMTSIQTM